VLVGHRPCREGTLCLDPKRHCEKAASLRAEIAALDHFKLGDVVEFLPERRTSQGAKVVAESSATYRYVELQSTVIAFVSRRGKKVSSWISLPVCAAKATQRKCDLLREDRMDWPRFGSRMLSLLSSLGSLMRPCGLSFNLL